MSNNVVPSKKGGFLSNNFDAFEAIADQASEGQSFGVYLKMSGNDGTWEYGQDKEALKTPVQGLLDPTSWERGVIVWVDGEVAGNYMTPALEGPGIRVEQAPDHGPYTGDDGPKSKQTVKFKLLDGTGLEVIFQGDNKSKIRAIENMMTEFKKTFRENQGMLPVVSIDSVSFEAKDPNNEKKKFKKYAPILKIVDWYSPEQVEEALSGNKAEYDSNDGADEIDTTPQAEAKKAQAAKGPAAAGRRGRFA